jgi:DNA-binding protein YbaB
MDMLKMVKEAASLRSKTKQIEKDLRSQIFEVSVGGVTIKANAKQEILDISISEQLYQQGAGEIEKNLLKGIKEVLNKAQKIMASETQKIMGNLNISGLKGMLGQ